jgi:hypothetical protein
MSNQSCRTLQELVDGTTYLAYLLLLGRYGMRDNPQSTTPLLQRLANLHEYVERWRTLCWSSTSEVITPEDTRACISMGGQAAVEATNYATGLLTIFLLPSAVRGVSSDEWTETYEAGEGRLDCAFVSRRVLQYKCANGDIGRMRMCFRTRQPPSSTRLPHAFPNYIDFNYDIRENDDPSRECLKLLGTSFVLHERRASGKDEDFRSVFGNCLGTEPPMVGLAFLRCCDTLLMDLALV